MSDQRDDDYMRGYRAAYASMAVCCAGELGGGDPAARLAFLEAERVRTVAALRRVCAEHGDNDWPDTLYLPDVVEKFLARHLDSDDAARDTGEPEAPSPAELRADANEAELRAVERSLRSLVEGWTASSAKWAARSRVESDPEALRWLGWSEGLEHAVLGLCRALGIERPVAAEPDAALAARCRDAAYGPSGTVEQGARPASAADVVRLTLQAVVAHHDIPNSVRDMLRANLEALFSGWGLLGPRGEPEAERWGFDRAEAPADRAQQSATLKAAELARRWLRAKLNMLNKLASPGWPDADRERFKACGRTWRVAIEDLCAAFAIPAPQPDPAEPGAEHARYLLEHEADILGLAAVMAPPAPSSAALTSAERYALRRGGYQHGPADGRWTRPPGESQRALFESDPHELADLRHAAARYMRARGAAAGSAGPARIDVTATVPGPSGEPWTEVATFEGPEAEVMAQALADSLPAVVDVTVSMGKPSRVLPGQVWRCVGVEGELEVLTVRDEPTAGFQRVRLEPGPVMATDKGMTGLKEWSFVRGPR
jgi:hypothetical protein